MSQAVQIFNNPEFGDVRVAGDFDNPRFCLADACKILGIGNPSDVKKRLDKGVVSIETLQTAGGMQNLTFINEDGLYDLILDSRKPAAKKFRKWITGEVIPSIRKTGFYINPNGQIDADLLIKIGNDMKKLQTERDAALNKVIELTPPAEYCEKVLKSKEHLTSELIAKEYGENAHWLHETLINYNVMYMRRRGKRCYYYMKAPYDKGGYRVSETVTLERGRTVVSHYWTQKGRHFVYNFLKKRGTVPLVEREEVMQNLLEEPK